MHPHIAEPFRQGPIVQRVFALSSIVLAFASALPVFGGDITVLVDSSGSFSSFGRPTVNNKGDVAFSAGLDAGGTVLFRTGPSGQGVLAASAGGYGFSSGSSNVVIDESANVAFQGSRMSGAFRGIYLADGGSVSTVVETNAPQFTQEYWDLDGNASGKLSYTSYNVASATTYYYDGSSHVVAASGGIYHRILGTDAINDLGHVLFRTDLNGMLYSTPSGNQLVAQSTVVRVSPGYALNNSDTALVGVGTNGGGTTLSLASGTTLTPITSINGPFSSFIAGDLNNFGVVAFGAELDAGGNGIFGGAAPAANKLVQSGDLLFNFFEISSVQLGGINDAGTVVFKYELTNGTTGIAVAQLPEPVAASIWLLGACIALMRRRHTFETRL